jgi:hypothetical protein
MDKFLRKHTCALIEYAVYFLVACYIVMSVILINSHLDLAMSSFSK